MESTLTPKPWHASLLILLLCWIPFGVTVGYVYAGDAKRGVLVSLGQLIAILLAALVAYGVTQLANPQSGAFMLVVMLPGGVLLAGLLYAIWSALDVNALARNAD